MSTSISYPGTVSQPGSPTAKTLAAGAVVALATAIAGSVYVAIHRLLRRLRGSNREVVGLNLSLGAHSDRPCEDDYLLTVKIALASWREDWRDAPIFAAGGNSTDRRPVYPAAFEEVTGVGALDESGREIVWDGSGNRVSVTQARYWVDVSELGVGSVGLSGDTGHPFVTWGGSSFATALHTAANV